MTNTSYILTAEMDPASFAWLNGLRREYFPPQRNHIPAHITLFHKLTPLQVSRLDHLRPPRTGIPLLFGNLIFLGAGVAVGVRSTRLEQLRTDIRNTMGGEFSRQDQQNWRPHVTVQNKVAADAAKRFHHSLNADFSERSGVAIGLLIWEYQGGPWTLTNTISFV